MGDWHGQGFTSDCVVPCGLRVFPESQFFPAGRHSVSFSEGKLQSGGGISSAQVRSSTASLLMPACHSWTSLGSWNIGKYLLPVPDLSGTLTQLAMVPMYTWSWFYVDGISHPCGKGASKDSLCLY